MALFFALLFIGILACPGKAQTPTKRDELERLAAIEELSKIYDQWPFPQAFASSMSGSSDLTPETADRDSDTD